MNPTTRAWKDPVFRATLNESERAALPIHPVGVVELDGIGLADIQGAKTEALSSAGCCGTAPFTFRTCAPFTCNFWTCWTCWGCN